MVGTETKWKKEGFTTRKPETGQPQPRRFASSSISLSFCCYCL